MSNKNNVIAPPPRHSGICINADADASDSPLFQAHEENSCVFEKNSATRSNGLNKKRIAHGSRLLTNIYVAIRPCFPKVLRPITENFGLYKIKHRNAFAVYTSLGNNCLGATLLKEMGLREFSGPLDWVSGMTLFRRLQLINERLNDFLNYEDFEFTKVPVGKEGTFFAKNRKIGATYPHDFVDDLQTNFELVKEKYNRRVCRLYEKSEGENVLFLYIECCEDNIAYDAQMANVMTALVRTKAAIKAKYLTLVMLIRSEKTDKFVDVFEENGCTVLLQHFESKTVPKDEWIPFSYVNYLVKHTILIATEMTA